MRTIWHSLAWKEWHEHKWKLAALMAVLCGVNLVFLPHLAGLSENYMMTLFSVVPLAVFLGANTSAGERSRGTITFLQALPVPQWKVAIHKALYGFSTLIVAIAVAFTFVFCSWWYLHHTDPQAESFVTKAWELFAPQVRIGNWFISSALTVSLVGGSLFLWTAVAGASAADEVSAGARAVIAVAIWWALLVMLAIQFVKLFGQGFIDSHRQVIATLIAAGPGGAAVGFPKWESLTTWAGSPTPVVWGIAFHLCLAAGFLFRFGGTASSSMSWPAAKATAERRFWPRRPWRSQFAALAWKQFRESGPIVLVGMAGIVGFTTLWVASQWEQIGRHPFLIVEAFSGTTAVASYFITLVVGIGVSFSDVSAQQNYFWRSRPISPDLWFWTKLVAGLVVLVCTLFVPAVISISLIPQVKFDRQIVMPLLAIVGANIAVYVAAVTVTSIVRHAVYSAILSIAAIITGFMAVYLFVTAVDRLVAHEPIFQSLEEYPSVTGMNVGLISVTVAVLLLGWLAVRFDWGQKN